MSETKKNRILSIAALIVGIVGVTLGYAAFSSVLTIESTAEVHPDSSTFNVDFSSSSSAVETNAIVPSLNTTATGFSATNATIDNTSDPVISNLSATFTEPGQSVTYSFYSYNAGEYLAYLNSIVFSGNKVCTAASGTTQSLVDTACTGISLSVAVGSEAATTTSVASITGHTLAKETAENVVVTISYAAGSGRSDGDFTVSFPDIVLTYASAD